MTAPTDTAALPADRRVALRRQPAFGTVCRLDPWANGNSAVGLVWNISETGVSMLVTDPRPAGSEIRGELTGEGGGPGLPVTLRVVHVRPSPTGDYFIGARFARPLEADELKPFLAPPPVQAPPQ